MVIVLREFLADVPNGAIVRVHVEPADRPFDTAQTTFTATWEA